MPRPGGQARFRVGCRGLVTMQDDCQRRRDWSGKSRNAVIWFFLAGQSDAQRWPIGLIAVTGWAADLVAEWRLDNTSARSHKNSIVRSIQSFISIIS